MRALKTKATFKPLKVDKPVVQLVFRIEKRPAGYRHRGMAWTMAFGGTPKKAESALKAVHATVAAWQKTYKSQRDWEQNCASDVYYAFEALTYVVTCEEHVCRPEWGEVAP